MTTEERIRVLLVDDDPDDALLARELLAEVQGMSCTVEWEDSFEGALSAIRERRHDIYIFDYRLGARTGLELLAEAEAAAPNTPVILFTGQEDREVDREAMESGATDYLVKGRIDADRLGRCLRYSLARKQTEKALRESEERSRAITGTANDAIVLVDAAGRISYWNQAASRIFGVSATEAMGRDMLSLTMPPRHHGLVRAALDGIHGESGPAAQGRTLEAKALRADRTEFPVEVSLSVLRMDDAWGSVWILRDISARKKAEEERAVLQALLRQRQKTEAIGTLAGGIAHEFNNILGAMLGFAEMARHSLAEEHPVRRDIDQILVGGRRARDLVRQLLFFSRQQMEKHRPQPMQLAPLVRETVEQVRASTPPAVTFQLTLDEDCGTVLATPEHMRLVLSQLCTNAVQAMPADKTGAIEVRLARVTVDAALAATDADLQEGAYIRLSVLDTGHGMDEATMARVFDPFFTTREVGKGTGLGLSVVLGLVQSCGGAVTVESTPGRGSSFHVYLPEFGPG